MRLQIQTCDLNRDVQSFKRGKVAIVVCLSIWLAVVSAHTSTCTLHSLPGDVTYTSSSNISLFCSRAYTVVIILQYVIFCDLRAWLFLFKSNLNQFI